MAVECSRETDKGNHVVVQLTPTVSRQTTNQAHAGSSLSPLVAPRKNTRSSALLYSEAETDAFTGFHENADDLAEEYAPAATGGGGGRTWVVQALGQACSFPSASEFERLAQDDEDVEEEEELHSGALGDTYLCVANEEQRATRGSSHGRRPSRKAEGRPEGKDGCTRSSCTLLWRCCKQLLTVCFCSFLHPLLAVVTVIVGVSVLALSPDLSTHAPLVFVYIFSTLVAEVAIAATIAVCLLGLRICCGERSVVHANAMCAITLTVLHALVYYAAAAVGLYIIFTDRTSWQGWSQFFTVPSSSGVSSSSTLSAGSSTGSSSSSASSVDGLSPTSTSFFSSKTPHTSAGSSFLHSPKSSDANASGIATSPQMLPFACYLYVVCQVCLCVVFTFNSCPVIRGAVAYAFHKATMKLTGQPEVSFHQGTAPVQYWSVDQYAQALPQMTNPVVILLPNATPGSRHADGGRPDNCQPSSSSSAAPTSFSSSC